MAKRLVLEVSSDELPDVWSLSTDLDAVPLVFRLNKALGWSFARGKDWILKTQRGVFAHAMYQFEEGPRNYSLLWNAAHSLEPEPGTAPTQAGSLFGDLEPDASASLFLSRPRGIKAFLIFDPPLSSQEIVNLQGHLKDVPGLLGCNPRTSLTPTEHAQLAYEPPKDIHP